MAPQTAPHSDLVLNLALAMIASSNVPLLLLDGAHSVIAASTSFCNAFRIDPASVQDRPIYALGAGEWDVPRLRSLLNATVSGAAEIAAYEIDLRDDVRGARRLVLNAHKLDYGDTEHVRLLLTVTDVTDARVSEKLKDDLAREKDELLREKAVLLQEVQHRVANSLQIIASVLMQSARKVQSEETRGHLHDAHNRVLSIAAVQQQLAASGLGNVGLRSYFTQLCESIGASMIRDHDQLSLEVTADKSTVSADTSVSLGLIVTELVINALKHAFPDNRSGKIKVDYRSGDAGWTLSVSDDGVGMPINAENTKPGLGTGIVEALARQLKAEIHVTNALPGTSVSVIHIPVAVVDMNAMPAARAV